MTFVEFVSLLFRYRLGIKVQALVVEASRSRLIDIGVAKPIIDTASAKETADGYMIVEMIVITNSLQCIVICQVRVIIPLMDDSCTSTASTPSSSDNKSKLVHHRMFIVVAPARAHPYTSNADIHFVPVVSRFAFFWLIGKRSGKHHKGY